MEELLDVARIEYAQTTARIAARAEIRGRIGDRLWRARTGCTLHLLRTVTTARGEGA